MSWSEQAYRWAEANLGIPPRTLSHLLASLVLILVVIVVRRLVVPLLTRRVEDPSRRYVAVKVLNYTQGFNFIWHEMPVTVTFESNWRKAKDLLTEIAQRHSAIRGDDAAREVRRAASRYLIRYEHLTPIV